MSQLPGAPGFRRTLCWKDLGHLTAGGPKLTVHETREAHSHRFSDGAVLARRMWFSAGRG